MPRGELLCKVEYVNWHPKYVRMRDRKAKYKCFICDSSSLIVDCRVTWTKGHLQVCPQGHFEFTFSVLDTKSKEDMGEDIVS